MHSLLIAPGALGDPFRFFSNARAACFSTWKKGGVATRRTLEAASRKHINAAFDVLQPLLQQSHETHLLSSHFAKAIAAKTRPESFQLLSRGPDL
jgi:hypothetical protein